MTRGAPSYSVTSGLWLHGKQTQHVILPAQRDTVAAEKGNSMGDLGYFNAQQ